MHLGGQHIWFLPLRLHTRGHPPIRALWSLHLGDALGTLLRSLRIERLPLIRLILGPFPHLGGAVHLVLILVGVGPRPISRARRGMGMEAPLGTGIVHALHPPPRAPCHLAQVQDPCHHCSHPQPGELRHQRLRSLPECAAPSPQPIQATSAQAPTPTHSPTHSPTRAPL